MPKGVRTNLVKRSLLVISGRKRPVYNAHKRLPLRYYADIHISKPAYLGIFMTARIKKISRMAAADFLINEGFAAYMRPILAEYKQLQRDIRYGEYRLNNLHLKQSK